MKAKIALLLTSVALVGASHGAISLGSTALKNVQGTTAGTDLVAGRLGLLIVDTAGDGFLGGYTASALASNALTPKNDFVNTTASLVIGENFLGDRVLARLTTAVAFSDTTIAGAFSGSIAGLESKNYAIVWFDTLTTAGSETLGSGSFGIARGADWTFPAADSGNFTFGTGAANLDQLTLANTAGGVATAAAAQGVSFATAGTTLSFVPEPSSALLGALGALGLLRRRRI